MGGAPAGNLFAFATQIKNAKNHTVQLKWDCWIGRTKEHLDANTVKSVFTYGDALDRLTEAVVADSSTARRQRILHVYNNTPQNVSVTTYRDQVNYLDGALQTSVHYDGLGRRIKERMREDGATWIETDSSYDGLGRLRMRSNPRRVGSRRSGRSSSTTSWGGRW
ncbi:MAG: hypothetical protein IPM24_12900 [Bryobacterales bacterium]|nr:hypothetical protein [Bryobacterales bacterium]